MYTFYISLGQLILLIVLFHVSRNVVDHIFNVILKRRVR